MRIRHEVNFVVLISIATLLAGCGSSHLSISSETDEMVFYESSSRIRGFDPVKAGDVASANAIGRIYEGLLQYAYLKRPYQVEPLLAASMPRVSEDGLTYTFELRDHIYFQDDPCFLSSGGKGRKLKAHDFVYSIKRLADLKTEASGYWAFNNRIAGLDEFRANSAGSEPTDYDLPVEGLRALNDRTLEIQLVRPYPQLLWVLTMHYAFAVPREAVEFYGDEFVNHPVGTGPYRLKEWRRNYRVEFERSPKWAETSRVELYPQEGMPSDAEKGLLIDAGKPVPFIDRVVNYIVADDEQTSWLLFMNGQLDRYKSISRDNWSVVVSPDRKLNAMFEERNIQMTSEPTIDVFYIGFNMDDPVVGKNKKLRQALSCAFDTPEWITFFNNRISEANGPIPPALAGTLKQRSPYAFDVDKAKQLLTEAGYPEGIDPVTGRRLELSIDIGSASNSEILQSTELFVDFMSRVGVVIKPVYNNWPAYLEKMDRRQVQLYRLGWIADYPDAENFLQLFYGPNSSPGPNHSNFVSAEFDKLYEEVRELQDGPKRTALYEKMSEMIVEYAPWIFTHYRMAYTLEHHWLENYKYHDFPYTASKYYKVNRDARSAWSLGGHP